MDHMGCWESNQGWLGCKANALHSVLSLWPHKRYLDLHEPFLFQTAQLLLSAVFVSMPLFMSLLTCNTLEHLTFLLSLKSGSDSDFFFFFSYTIL